MTESHEKIYSNEPRYLLEFVIRQDPDEITAMVAHGIADRSLYSIERDKSAVIEVDRLVLEHGVGELEDTIKEEPDIYVHMFEAICYGRNVGRYLLSTMPELSSLGDVPDLSQIPGSLTKDDHLEAADLCVDSDHLGELIHGGVEGIAAMSRDDHLYFSLQHMVGIVLLFTERQASDRL